MPKCIFIHLDRVDRKGPSRDGFTFVPHGLPARVPKRKRLLKVRKSFSKVARLGVSRTRCILCGKCFVCDYFSLRQPLRLVSPIVIPFRSAMLALVSVVSERFRMRRAQLFLSDGRITLWTRGPTLHLLGCLRPMLLWRHHFFCRVLRACACRIIVAVVRCCLARGNFFCPRVNALGGQRIKC